VPPATSPTASAAARAAQQCEAWDIAGEGSFEGVPLQDAISELEGFLADGQRALSALKRGERYGDA
jgi:hypothetical protein